MITYTKGTLRNALTFTKYRLFLVDFETVHERCIFLLKSSELPTDKECRDISYVYATATVYLNSVKEVTEEEIRFRTDICGFQEIK